MSDDTEIMRVSYGRTEALQLIHGAEITFDALPAIWENRDEVEVELADGSKLTLAAQPDHGPNVFSWKRAPFSSWHIRLEPLRPNVLQVRLEDHQHSLLAEGF